MKKTLALAPVGLVLSAGSALAQATGPDYSALTGALDVTSTIAMIMSVGGVMVGVALAVMGVRKFLRMVRA